MFCYTAKPLLENYWYIDIRCDIFNYLCKELQSSQHDSTLWSLLIQSIIDNLTMRHDGSYHRLCGFSLQSVCESLHPFIFPPNPLLGHMEGTRSHMWGIFKSHSATHLVPSTGQAWQWKQMLGMFLVPSNMGNAVSTKTEAENNGHCTHCAALYSYMSTDCGRKLAPACFSNLNLPLSIGNVYHIRFRVVVKGVVLFER